MPRRQVKIGLLWHSFHSANLGCGALSVCNLEIIKVAAAKAGVDPEFHVFGTGDNTLSYEPAGEIRTRTVLTLRDLLTGADPLRSRLKACDIFFDLSAGDSLTDHYSFRSFLLMILSKRAAAATGKPLVLAPQTIGPFLKRSNRMMARRVIAKADTIFARDDKSFFLLQELGLGSRSKLSTDVAFILSAQPDQELKRERHEKLRVGFNVSALLYSDHFQLPGHVEYADLVDMFIARLSSDPSIEIHLVPHVFAASFAREDDLLLARKLAAKYPQLHVPPPFSNPSEAKGFIASLDLLIASRMHAVIAALSAGRPALALGYSRKFTGLLHGLGYPFVSDLSRTGAQLALRMLERILADLPGATAKASDASVIALNRLDVYRSFVEERMRQFAREETNAFDGKSHPSQPSPEAAQQPS